MAFLFLPKQRTPFDPPTLLESFVSSPLRFFLCRINALLLLLRGSSYQTSRFPIRIVCISDTHCKTLPPEAVPAGDILIHAGDLTDRKSTRLNSSHSQISYAVFCLKKKK